MRMYTCLYKCIYICVIYVLSITILPVIVHLVVIPIRIFRLCQILKCFRHFFFRCEIYHLLKLYHVKNFKRFKKQYISLSVYVAIKTRFCVCVFVCAPICRLLRNKNGLFPKMFLRTTLYLELQSLVWESLDYTVFLLPYLFPNNRDYTTK